METKISGQTQNRECAKKIGNEHKRIGKGTLEAGTRSWNREYDLEIGKEDLGFWNRELKSEMGFEIGNGYLKSGMVS